MPKTKDHGTQITKLSYYPRLTEYLWPLDITDDTEYPAERISAMWKNLMEHLDTAEVKKQTLVGTK